MPHQPRAPPVLAGWTAAHHPLGTLGHVAWGAGSESHQETAACFSCFDNSFRPPLRLVAAPGSCSWAPAGLAPVAVTLPTAGAHAPPPGLAETAQEQPGGYGHPLSASGIQPETHTGVKLC